MRVKGKHLLPTKFLFAMTCCLPLGLIPRTVMAQPPATPAPPAVAKPLNVKPITLDQKTREKVFEIVWSKINEQFFDPKFNGVDWQLMRRRYLPLAVQANTDAAFYEALNKMLGELRESHIGILPPEVYADRDTAQTAPPSGTKNAKEESEQGTAGITVQWIEEKPIITAVVPESGGAVAGIRPGYVLTGIDDKEVDTIVARFKKAAKVPRDFKTLVRLGFPHFLDGPAGSEVVVRFLDADDKPQTMTVKRTPLVGEVVQFGELPPILVQTETKRLDGNIGYIRANIFMMPILQKVRTAINEMSDTKGIILDLRGNPGGIGLLSSAIAGSFYAQRTNLGTMRMRRGNINFLAYPQPTVYKIYTRPLVILTDEGSASTSEIMAGGMQENGRAVVIGSETAGEALPSLVEKLPGGARFQYAIADFKTPKGVLLEGRGVQPNIPIVLTRAALLSGTDPVLSAAIEYITKKETTTKK